ncbi:MAG: single-stranded DNA-binding protein [Thermaerobacter sp.]|nr:single-stranded DNA-binding protein [Thermaerobacter sp.]
MLNRVILIGRLTRKPEMRYTPGGAAVAHFGLAVDRPRRSDGQEAGVDFIDITVWQKLAEVCTQHLDKGRLVAVDGRLQIRSWEGQDGQKRRAAEVVAQTVRFLDRPRESAAGDDLAGLGEEVIPGEDVLPF